MLRDNQFNVFTNRAVQVLAAPLPALYDRAVLAATAPRPLAATWSNLAVLVRGADVATLRQLVRDGLIERAVDIVEGHTPAARKGVLAPALVRTALVVLAAVTARADAELRAECARRGAADASVAVLCDAWAALEGMAAAAAAAPKRKQLESDSSDDHEDCGEDALVVPAKRVRLSSVTGHSVALPVAHAAVARPAAAATAAIAAPAAVATTPAANPLSRVQDLVPALQVLDALGDLPPVRALLRDISSSPSSKSSPSPIKKPASALIEPLTRAPVAVLRDLATRIMVHAARALESGTLHHRCGHLACTNTEAGLATFSRCGKCRVVRYCSRSCQVAAWKAGHRFWCAHAAAQCHGGEHQHQHEVQQVQQQVQQPMEIVATTTTTAVLPTTTTTTTTTNMAMAPSITGIASIPIPIPPPAPIAVAHAAHPARALPGGRCLLPGPGGATNGNGPLYSNENATALYYTATHATHQETVTVV
ncbi:hypothetical protein GGF31_007751 [Allomyces arbusculus]|nr:hypothetical protein GGF31_007751 [Allomyces arbusculus]